MSEFQKLVGEQIRFFRKEKGMTQEQLANACGFQYSYLSDIERGERNISLETLERLINALDIIAVELFNFNYTDTDNESLEKRMIIESLRALLATRRVGEVRHIHNVAIDFVKTVDQGNQ